MVSDEDDHIATGYVDEFLEDDDVSEEEEEDDQSLQFQPIDEDEDEDVDLVDDDDEDDSMSSPAVATSRIPTVTVTTAVTPPLTTTATVADPVSQSVPDLVKKPLPLDDSRRLFQRLWTDEDEIELLQGFLDYTTQRGTNGSSHHHHDTTAFYDQIKSKLQLDFNKNQLVEKLRRLKKKYRNVLSKISTGKEYLFKSPHDQATFDISCKIWSETPVSTFPGVDSGCGNGGGLDDDEVQNLNSNPAFNLNDNNGNESEIKVPTTRKRTRFSGVKIEENCEQQKLGNPNLVEETVKSCLLPLFKELVNNNSANGTAFGNSIGSSKGLMNMNHFGGLMNFGIGDMSDEKWRKQHILELEVCLKRVELMQDQIKAKLDELKAMGSR